MTERHPIWRLTDEIQMDIRATTAKLVELRAHLVGLNIGADTPTRPLTRTERALLKAKELIDTGAWDVLDRMMLDVELDLLGIPHCDRGQAYTWHKNRAHTIKQPRFRHGPATALTPAENV